MGGVLTFFIEFNRYTASLLSIPLLLRTFFKPLKNEYRQGLVLFSIVAGVLVKGFLVSIGCLIIIFLLCVEALVGLLIAVLPLILIVLLMGGADFIR